MAGTSSKKGKHHDTITSVRTHQEKNIEQLVDCINRFTNPFSEESADLFNLVTKVVMPEKVKEDLCQQSVIGNTMLCRFVEDRIKSNKQCRSKGRSWGGPVPPPQVFSPQK